MGGATTIDCTCDSANGISEYGYACDLEGYGSSKCRLLSSGPLHIPSMPHSPVRLVFSLKNRIWSAILKAFFVSIWLNFHISYCHKISYPACCLAWFEIISPLRWSTFDCFFFLFLDFLFLLRLRFRFFRFLLFFLPFLDLNMFRYLFTEGSSPINFSRSSFKGGLSFKVTWFTLEPSPNRSLNLENYIIWHNRLSLGSAKKYITYI